MPVRPARLLTASVLLFLTAAPCFAQTVYGVLPAKLDRKTDAISVAKELDVPVLRLHMVMQQWNGTWPPFDKARAAGLQIAANVNDGSPATWAGKAPVPFPTDLAAYRKTLDDILTKYPPALLAVENEEDNKGYHSGPIEDYIAELAAATEVAHAHGIKVTNGGITSTPVRLLVWDDYMSRGLTREAQDYADRALPAHIAQALATGSADHNKRFAETLAMEKKLIAAYRSIPIDYVNFHWYEPVRSRGGKQGVGDDTPFDMRALGETIAYLKRATGKPVLSNEIGQLNASAALTAAMLDAATRAGLSYVIWYSGDGGTGKAVALQNADGTLRPTGEAFRDFVAAHR